MELGLVTPLVISDFVDPEPTMSAGSRYSGPPLGILSLSSTLTSHGLASSILNIDEYFLDFFAAQPAHSHQDLFSYIAERVSSPCFDVLGFGSICSSYPLTLRLAQEVKRLHPDTTIVLGGPQASVVDVETLEEFPFVDYVVRGEAEETFPQLLDALSSSSSAERVSSMRGITFRRGNQIVRTPNALVIQDMDCLPLPAYHLDPSIHQRKSIHLEIGRGCPYACTFCSTNDFFRRKFRLKSTQKVIDEMAHLRSEYGISFFNLVHDMYTVNRRKVVEFCEALLETGESFAWGCSARTDSVDDELLGLMARAGCRGIFFGVETGSPRMQKIINKKLDLDEARAHISSADRHGISTAVALIMGFPEETRSDLRDSVEFFVNAMRYDHAEPQLSLLSPLAQTPIQTEHKDQLVFDGLFSNITYQGYRQDPRDVELVQKYPAVFPNFYGVPTQHLERRYFKEVHDLLFGLTVWFRWLPIGLMRDSGDFLDVCDLWFAWSNNRRQETTSEEAASKIDVAAPYCFRSDFRDDFVDFVEDAYIPQVAKWPELMHVLAQVEGGGAPAESEAQDQRSEDPCLSIVTGDAYPYHLSLLREVELNWDFDELVGCLRRGSDFANVSARRVTVLVKALAEGGLEVRQLPPLLASLWRVCDGSRTVRDITELFAARDLGLDGIPAAKTCAFGLRSLVDDGLLGLSPRPVSPAGMRQEDIWVKVGVAASE
jgi:radical SAM superfamily enzyme YgiQ (UPF0313 family)